MHADYLSQMFADDLSQMHADYLSQIFADDLSQIFADISVPSESPQYLQTKFKFYSGGRLRGYGKLDAH